MCMFYVYIVFKSLCEVNLKVVVIIDTFIYEFDLLQLVPQTNIVRCRCLYMCAWYAYVCVYVCEIENDLR